MIPGAIDTWAPEVQEPLFTPNYVVTIDGRYEVHCETEDDVWRAIESAGWASHQTTSPKGLPVDQFIPF